MLTAWTRGWLAVVLLAIPIAPAGDDNKAEKDAVKFVASKKSDVFHARRCRFVEKILKEHRVEFTTRDEALNAGKRACKVCNP